MSSVSAVASRFLWFQEEVVDSTNVYLREKLNTGQISWAVVWAHEQTAGRGRLGRSWLSPRGGLYLSLSLPVDSAIVPHAYTMAAAVAIVECLQHNYQMQVGLKWPNDILAVRVTPEGTEEEKKLGGILAERMDAPHGPHLVVGIGLNVHAEIDLPGEQDRLPPSSISEHSRTQVAIPDLVERVVQYVGTWWDTLLSQDSSDQTIQCAWKMYSRTLGRRVRLHTPTEILEGVATDISSSWALLLKTEKEQILEIYSADCMHLRNAF